MLDLKLPELDNTRLFSAEQKEQIWVACNSSCGICDEYLDRPEAEYDHIKPWILGGRTEVANGRAVHARCHLRGVAAVADSVATSQAGATT
ncbi:MAG: HNH endonuclease [Geodermatophilaceae bacterium]